MSAASRSLSDWVVDPLSLSTAIGFQELPEPAGQRDDTHSEKRHSRRILYVLLAIQGLSALVFLADLWSEVLGIRHTPLPYEFQEIIQIGASIGLLAGMFTTALVLSQSFRRVTDLSRQVDVASGKFQTHLDDLFLAWELSPSEKEVAVFAMKGFSNAEIAELRGTGASTIKSQLNAIYRKSGCANRQQLTSYLVEELLSGVTARA